MADHGPRRLESLIEDLGSGPPTMEEAFYNLRLARSRALNFLALALKHKKLRREVIEILDPIVSLDPDLLDYRRNIRETDAWLAFIEVLALRDDDGPSVLEAAKAILVSREEPTSEEVRQDIEELFSRWWADRKD